MKVKRDSRGFTLVEMVVTLVIVVLLAAIAVPSMLGFVKQARESEAYAHLRTVRVALSLIETQAQVDGTFSEGTSVSLSYPNRVGKLPDIYLEKKLEALLPDPEALSHVEVTVDWYDNAVQRERVVYYLGEGRSGDQLVYENGTITRVTA